MSRKTTSRVAACGVAASLLLALAGTSAVAQTVPAPATTPDVTAVALSADKKNLVLTGERLTGATLVLVGDNAIKVDTKAVPAKVTDTTVTVKAPSAAIKGGDYWVAVVTPNGVDAFEHGYGVVPAVTGVTSPTADTTGRYAALASVSDLGGTKVRLVGSGFTGLTDVSFGKAAGTDLKVLSDTTATVTVPAKSADDAYSATKPVTLAVPIVAENRVGATDELKARKITYAALPTVTKGDKTSSKFDVATVKLTLEGTNLNGASVKFGTKTGVRDSSSTATKLVVTVPVATAASEVDVFVKTAAAEIKLARKWVYSTTTPTDTPWPAA